MKRRRIMPSYCIHVAHGIKTLELLGKYLESCSDETMFNDLKEKFPEAEAAIKNNKDNEWKKQFMAGLIFPDSAKQSQCKNADYLDREAHFQNDLNSYFKKPSMTRFLKGHLLSLNNPLYLGYAMHLYLDIQYDEFLKGVVTFVPGTVSSDPYFVHKESRNPNNSNGSKKDKILTTDEFWKTLYDDYTKLNSYYMEKYNFNIKNFATVDQIDPESVTQIPWYKNLYDKFDDILKNAQLVIDGNQTSGNISSLTLLDCKTLDALLNKTSRDFMNYYLKPLFYKAENKGSFVNENNSENNTDILQNQKWKSELTKIKYYKTCWNQLVEEGVVSLTDNEFFNGVINEINDVTNSAFSHKKIYGVITVALCILSILATTFSAVVTALSKNENPKVSWVCFGFGVASTFISASITALTQYNEKTSHKEAWLRQRLYYSMLMNETELFCERIDKYSELGDTVAIKIYMDNIKTLRKRDYENFFINMGCSNFENN